MEWPAWRSELTTHAAVNSTGPATPPHAPALVRAPGNRAAGPGRT
jgi:hypothetical protein